MNYLGRVVMWLLILGPLCGCSPDPFAGLPRTLPPLEIYFSPHGGCTEAVVREIQAARSKILVQAYSFTSAPIAKALVEAQRRGVDARVILDKSQETEKYSSATFLLHSGIRTRIDAEHAIAHNKVMVLDDAVVVTGSFNFTASAESRNAENLLVIRDPQIARKYRTNWQDHWSHSLDYTGAKSGPEHTPSRRAEKASLSRTPPPRGDRNRGWPSLERGLLLRHADHLQAGHGGSAVIGLGHPYLLGGRNGLVSAANCAIRQI